MDRILGVTGIAVAVAGFWAVHALDPAMWPASVGAKLVKQESASAHGKAVVLLAEAVRRDSANSFVWEDFAEALTLVGRNDEAREASQRATTLADGMPQIWFHDATLRFKLGDFDAGLQSVSRVFDQVSDYDATFFTYFDNLGLKPNDLLEVLKQNRRASRAYLEHLVATNNALEAQEAWHTLSAEGFLDDHLTSSYISCLLQNHFYEVAQRDWAASRKPSEYPDKNLVFNGGFEQEFTECPLDWAVQSSDEVETARDDSVTHEGKWALRIHFLGKSNLNYSNLVETVRVQPGEHVFRAWVRTAGVTTDEGIRFEIFDMESPSRLDLETTAVVGTQDWVQIEKSFTVPEPTNLIGLRVIRLPSKMFNNLVDGTAWVDSVSIQAGS